MQIAEKKYNFEQMLNEIKVIINSRVASIYNTYKFQFATLSIDKEDLCQEVAIKLLAKTDILEQKYNESGFKGYVSNLVKNLLFNIARDTKRKVTNMGQKVELNENLLKKIYYEDYATKYSGIINEVCELKDVHNLSFRQIAKKFNVYPSLIHRLYNKVKL